MPALFPHLPLHADETPLSFGARLAAFHLDKPLVPFLHDIGVRPDALALGEGDAIDRLAAVADVDPLVLHRNCARSIAKFDYILRGHTLSSEVFSRPDTVFCPACLNEDDAASDNVATSRRQRLSWTLRPVRTCERHGLSLIHRRAEGYDRKFHEMARQVPERGAELCHLIDGCARREPSPLQAYVLDRLKGLPGPAWLDSQTLEQAVRTSEYVGALVAFGPSVKVSELRHDQWDEAGRVGFAVTSDGEAGIRLALSDAQTSFALTDFVAGRRKIFGALYEWLSSTKLRKDPGDVRRIMREHIFDTMAIDSVEVILGEALKTRRLHSVQSLASESGLNPKTLRNILSASALIRAEPKFGADHVFDAEAGRRLAAQVPRAINVSKLPEALGCTRPLVDQLLDERLLRPLAEGLKDSAGRLWKSVSKDAVDELLEALCDSARPVASAPVGMVSLSKAAERAKVQSVEIVHLILAGLLRNVARLHSVSGFASLLVDPEEVRAAVQTHLKGLSVAGAFGKLCLPKAVGWALVERDSEPRLPAIEIRGFDGRHSFFRFDDRAISVFKSEFTTVARIASANGLEQKVVVAGLKSVGVRPVIRRDDVGRDFYRQADIPHFEVA